MAQVKHLVFTKATVTGVQSVTGVGFQGVAVIFWSTKQTATGLVDGIRWMQGMADGTRQFCRQGGWQDNAASPQSSQIENVTHALQFSTLGGTPSVLSEATFSAFTADGFDINWTTNDGSADRIHALVIACDAAFISHFKTTGTSAGVAQDISGVGFAPDAIIWIPGSDSAGTGYNLGSPFGGLQGFGVSDPAAISNGSMFAITPGANGGASSLLSDNDCLDIPLVTGIFRGYTVNAQKVTASLPDGFRIVRQASFGVTNTYQFALCLSGIRVSVGSFNSPTAVGDQVIPLAFEANALFLLTTGENTGARFSVGAWDGTGQGVASIAGLVGTPTITASADTDNSIVRVVQPAATAASSTDKLRAAVASADATGITLTWATVDVSARTMYYMAFGDLEVPIVANCSDGDVPQVDDPSDGSEWEGLGPHEDRFFVEVDLDSGTERWAMHDPMRDSPEITPHPGFKEGRIVSCDSIVRRTTDRLGGWQASTVRFTLDDHDRRIRGLIASNQWYNREVRIYIAKRTDVPHARCLFRGIIRAYPPKEGFLVDVEAADIIGTEFSPFSLDKDILASAVFDGVRFPDAPTDLLKQTPQKPIPVYGGLWSDEASDVDPPVLIGNPAIGSGHADVMWRMGFGSLTDGPEAPAGLSAVVSSGGSISSDILPTGRMFAQVWAVDASGNVGDPYPFLPTGLPITVTGTGNKITLTVTPSGGPTPDKYRFALATEYFGARWGQILEVSGVTTSVVFDSHPALIGSTGSMTAGAFAPTLSRRRYIVVALIGSARTGASETCAAYENTPYYRPIHVTNIPVTGATSYEVYATQQLQFTDGSPLHTAPSSIFNRKWSVPVQLDADGYQYFEDRFDDDGVEFVDGATVPEGMLPVTYAGDEIIDGVNYGRLVLCRWPTHLILGVYAGGKRLANNHPDLRHPDHPSWSFPDRFVTISGLDLTIIYARQGSAILAAHLDGTALIQVNACTTEDVGDGTGSTIVVAPRLVQHMVVELIRNDHLTGLWAGVPTFPDGTPEVRTSSYRNAETMEIARVGGTGYTARIAIVEPTTVRQFFENVVQSFGLHHGINRHGQVLCGHYDDGVDTTVGYPHFQDVREVTGSIEVDPRTSELENRIPYEWDFRPVSNSLFVVNQFIPPKTEGSAAITANRGIVNLGPVRSLPYAADVVTVNDVMQRLILLGNYVKNYVGIPTSIIGQSQDLFQIVRLTDEEGIGSEGYVEHFILILEHETDPPDPSGNVPLTTRLRGLDITALADAAFTWGPDSLTDWDAMTEDERGTYGAYAAEDDTIPTDNSPAKEWR